MNFKITTVLLIIYFTFALPLVAQNAKIESLVASVSQKNIQQHLDSLSYAGGYKSRISYTPGNYIAADYIARYFESLPGITYVERDTFYMGRAAAPYDKYPLINIIAHIDGQAENPKSFIIGGHYDASGSNQSNYNTFWSIRQAQGSDDNATGVATTMELARILSDPVLNFTSANNIRFIAFAAEENHPVYSSYHHLGSLYDVQKIGKEAMNVNGVLMLDMIGYNPNYDYVEVISDQASTWLADSVLINADRYVPDLYINDHPLPDVPYSDHQSYQEAGYPAILLMENDAPWNSDLPYYIANPYYHTESDVISTVRMSQVIKVARLGLATVAELNMNGTVSGLTSLVLENDAHGQIDVSPNPFNSETKIQFTQKNPGPVTVRIFDIMGRAIVTLLDSQQKSGYHSIHWDGTNSFGQPVVSGNYILSVKFSNHQIVRRLALVK